LGYSIRHIAFLVNGSFLQFRRDDRIDQLLTDSRRLVFPETSLFFALYGPRRNGHAFLQDLYNRGLRNFIVYQKVELKDFESANIILVSDCLLALQQLAAFHRQQYDYPVIGITGSNGKTIVKEWLNQLLEDKYHIARSPRSYNSQIGVPLSVWQMNETHDLAILEAGISKPGEMQTLAAMIDPGIGVFTNIGGAHDEGFENTESKILEKLRLFERADVLIYPSDEKMLNNTIRSWHKKYPGLKLFSYGEKGSALQVLSKKKMADSTELMLSYDGNQFPVFTAFVHEAAIANMLTCITALLYLGIPRSDLQQRLKRLSPVAMRMEIQSGINHCAVINDSYSADINSLKMALDFLSLQQQHARRTVILSDILESGRSPENLYSEVAALLKKYKVDRLIAIGEQISANRKLFTNVAAHEPEYYPTTDAFLSSFQQLAFRDETILLKGARVFGFERIDQVLSLQMHETQLEVNLDAMAHNLRQYQQLLKPSTRVMAMVKAFSYGAGGFEIARLLEFHKVDYLAVAYADEGVALRKSGIRLPIMVMNTEASALDALLEYQLEPVLYSFNILRAMDQLLKREAVGLFPVHIELETGMNRLGFASKDMPELLEILAHSSAHVQSVFSHLAASEEAQQDVFTRQQFRKYQAMVEQLAQFLPYPFLKHISNSAAVVRDPSMQLDMVRLGIGLYGIDPADSSLLDLKTVGTLRTTIAQIKSIAAGETIGYNRKGVAEKAMKIATVRLGYADGYPRSLGNGVGKMWYKGQLVPTVGSLCMDMSMLDITGIDDAREDDELIVFGPELPVEQLAHWAGTIPYELLAGISQRVKRVYFE
jgi:alanine racemase